MNTPPNIPPEALETITAQPEPEPPPILTTLFTLLWRDRAFQFLLVLTLLVNLALFAYLALRFATLPDLLPLHFDTLGLPDRIESKNGIFALPIIGILVFAINTALGIFIHQSERAATILLTAGTLSVQVLMWLAVINIAGIV